MKKQSGISLLEVLISLFLVSIILSLIIHIYLGGKRQYFKTEKILSTEFDVQWVSDLLSDSIRRAGFTPCLGIDQLQIIDRRNKPRVIHALHYHKPCQQLQITRMNEQFAPIIQVQSPTRLLIKSSKFFHKNRAVLIADCIHGEVHEIFNMDQQLDKIEITLNKPLLFTYTTSAYVGELFEESWFIKKNSKGTNTLYYKMLQTEEVTSLIHSIHVNNKASSNKQLLEVLLGIDQNKIHQVLVAVRG